MKKSFFLLAVLFLFVGVVGFAENSSNENPLKTGGWSFFAEPVFGLRIGKDNEIVWNKNTQTGKTYKLSELEWIYTPSLYFGANIGAEYKRFAVSFLSKIFLPMKCGTMKDSDWVQDAYYYTGNTSIKTNYSESENHLRNAQDIELGFGFKFYPTYFLTLRPKISVNYNHSKFSAVGGTYWYGNDISNNKSGSSYYPYDSANAREGKLNGEVLSYEIHNVYLWLGLHADFIPTKKIILSVATEAAPLVYMISFDTHIKRNLEYKQESLSVFYAVRQTFSALFKIDELISISLWLQGILTGETSGPSYYKYKSSSSGEYIRDGNGGARTMYLDTGFSLRFSW